MYVQIAKVISYLNNMNLLFLKENKPIQILEILNVIEKNTFYKP